MLRPRYPRRAPGIHAQPPGSAGCAPNDADTGTFGTALRPKRQRAIGAALTLRPAGHPRDHEADVDPSKTGWPSRPCAGPGRQDPSLYDATTETPQELSCSAQVAAAMSGSLIVGPSYRCRAGTVIMRVGVGG